MSDFIREGTKFFKSGKAADILSNYKGVGSDQLQEIAGKLQSADNGAGTHSDFKSAVIANGLQRSNRFAVVVTFPPAISSRLTDERTYSQKIGLMCGNVTIPTKTVNLTQGQAFGTPYNVATNIETDQLSLSFLVQNDHSEFAIFNHWMNTVHSYRRGTVGYYDDYISPEIRVYPLDTANNHNYVYIMEECYPISLAVSDYSNETNDSINTLTVSFSVRRFGGDNQDIPNPALTPEPDENRTIVDTIRESTQMIGAIDSNLSKLESFKNKFKF